jgi:hypothetical protein
MGTKRKGTIGVAFAVIAGLLFAGALASCRKGPSSVTGAVLERNSDPRKESPIANVEVSATIGSSSSVTKTGASGEFRVPLRRWIRRGQPLILEFRHAGYAPVTLNDAVAEKIYVVRMSPLAAKAEPPPDQAAVAIANVRIRYSAKTTGAVSVGSAVKTFEVVNKGNVPCDNTAPCSPDGKWKAAVGSTTVDAGEGNEFRNVRISCIAGPCPFTRVQSDEDSHNGKVVNVSVLNWSDTATFLLEAEVYHPMESELIREAHPAIFGRTLNFSVPGTAEGQTIEADVNGEPIVFPLGPNLCLSWADCTVTGDRDHSKTFRCELKSGYTFR